MSLYLGMVLPPDLPQKRGVTTSANNTISNSNNTVADIPANMAALMCSCCHVVCLGNLQF